MHSFNQINSGVYDSKRLRQTSLWERRKGKSNHGTGLIWCYYYCYYYLGLTYFKIHLFFDLLFDRSFCLDVKHVIVSQEVLNTRLHRLNPGGKAIMCELGRPEAIGRSSNYLYSKKKCIKAYYKQRDILKDTNNFSQGWSFFVPCFSSLGFFPGGQGNRCLLHSSFL